MVPITLSRPLSIQKKREKTVEMTLSRPLSIQKEREKTLEMTLSRPLSIKGEGENGTDDSLPPRHPTSPFKRRGGKWWK